MLVHRLRRWTSIIPTLIKRFVLTAWVDYWRPFHTSLQTRDIHHSGTTTRCCFRNYLVQLGWEKADIISCLPHLYNANKDMLKERPVPMAHSYRLGLVTWRYYLRIPVGPDICHRGCAYTVRQTVQRHGVYSASYGIVHYKKPSKSFEIRVGHSPGFGLPSFAILPWLCGKRLKAIFTDSMLKESRIQSAFISGFHDSDNVHRYISNYKQEAHVFLPAHPKSTLQNEALFVWFGIICPYYYYYCMLCFKALH